MLHQQTSTAVEWGMTAVELVYKGVEMCQQLVSGKEI